VDITRRKVEDKISRKSKEIQELIEEKTIIDNKIMTLSAEQKGMEDILKMLPTDEKDEKCRTIRPTSQAGKAQKFLKKQIEPVHISKILIGIKVANSNKNRGALASTLRAYANRGEVFTLPAPNTFGLVEWVKNPPKQGVKPKLDLDKNVEA